MFSLFSPRFLAPALLASAFIFSSSFLAADARAHADEPLSSYSLVNPSPENLRTIAKLFEITHREGTTFEIIVPSNQTGLLRLLEPSATLLEADMGSNARAKLQTFRQTLFAESSYRYRSLSEVQDWMRAVASQNPAIAELVPYGKSQSGLDLLALRISKKDEHLKPAIMITAATHGDELITTAVTIELVNQLIAGYGTNPRFSAIVDNRDTYFIPVVNVEGFSRTERYEVGKDPNRSYPFPNRPSATPTPSIAALMQFFHDKEIVGSLDFHAYGEMIMYPWAYTRDPVEAEASKRFDLLTRSMAQMNNYAYGPISEVIYIAPGSSADYYFWQKGSTSLAIEMGRSKIPSPSEIPGYIEDQAESTWRFLEAF